jgi:hypothetical protein
MFTVNIQKGGAMLEDARRLVEVWDDAVEPDENLRRIAERNLLGKTSRRRTEDVLRRILKPRYVVPGPAVIPALRGLASDQSAFRDACFYETARDDELLAAFAEGPVFEWYSQGRVGVTVDDASAWLEELTGTGQLPKLTDNVRTKVGRGLLAALRDFAVLRGAVRKEFNPPGMSPRGFVYVAFREHQQGASGRALVESTIWRRWLLDERWVNDLFTQADRLGVLHYARAGSAVRIDWRVDDLAGVVRAAA